MNEFLQSNIPVYIMMGYSILATIWIWVLLFKQIKLSKKLKAKKVIDITYEEAKDVLDTIIAHVITDKELSYNMNGVKYIKSPDKDIKIATAEVLSLVSPIIMNTLEQYVTRQYIITYTSRNIRSFIMAYLDQKK